MRKFVSDINTEEAIFENPDDLFRALWKKYTYNEADEGTGFLNAGGNSVSAMQIVNSMSAHGLDVTLATSLMSDMLNNKSLVNCSHLLSVYHDRKETCTVVEGEANNRNIKRLKKVNENDEIIHVMMKGCTSNLFVGLLEIPKLKISWHFNLSKCVDASATCIVYKRLVMYQYFALRLKGHKYWVTECLI